LKGDLEGARDTLKRARDVGAANADIYLWSVSLRQGRRAEARAELARAVDVFGPRLPPGTGAIVADGILDEGAPRVRALAWVRELVAEPATAESGILAYALILLDAPDEALAMIEPPRLSRSSPARSVSPSCGTSTARRTCAARPPTATTAASSRDAVVSASAWPGSG